MEFELWLFAVKQLAQSYEMTQVIYSQLPQGEKDSLKKEYERSVGGAKSSDKNKASGGGSVKKYEELIGNFLNSMSVSERFLERNSIRYIRQNMPASPDDPDEEFLLRMFINLELSVTKVNSCLKYLGMPVTAAGELKVDEFGQYYVQNTLPSGSGYGAGSNNRRPVTDGMFIEFMTGGRWELGKLRRDADAPFGCFFAGSGGEEFHINPNGLKVRLRG